ncbi:hypothetical protein FA95DRAFT_108052, partial [Auriscalpium vulgare]
ALCVGNKQRPGRISEPDTVRPSSHRCLSRRRPFSTFSSTHTHRLLATGTPALQRSTSPALIRFLSVVGSSPSERNSSARARFSSSCQCSVASAGGCKSESDSGPGIKKGCVRRACVVGWGVGGRSTLGDDSSQDEVAGMFGSDCMLMEVLTISASAFLCSVAGARAYSLVAPIYCKCCSALCCCNLTL